MPIRPLRLRPLGEKPPEDSPLRLSELSSRISNVLHQSLGQHAIRVVAEIAQISRASSGHVYFELVEKEGDAILARLRGNCWRQVAQHLMANFESSTGMSLKAGMEILASVRVGFHAAYGLSVTIEHIDPEFTLGALARQRREVIHRLEAKKLLELNKRKILSLVPQRLAIISSPTAAGYEDFVDQLNSCSASLSVNFEMTLFPALMQGDQASADVVKQIAAIVERSEAFDALILIRGGGASLDLHCFDDYALCEALAQCSLPVITGIGHERDHAVADMVAHTHLKTPTAVAEYLVDCARKFCERLIESQGRLRYLTEQKIRLAEQGLGQSRVFLLAAIREHGHRQKQKVMQLGHHISHGVHAQLRGEEQRLSLYAQLFERAPQSLLRRHQDQLTQTVKHFQSLSAYRLSESGRSIGHLSRRFKKSSEQCFRLKKSVIQQFAAKVEMLDPEALLKRGYSLTFTLDGKGEKKLLRHSNGVKVGDKLITKTVGGMIYSQVEKQSENKND